MSGDRCWVAIVTSDQSQWTVVLVKGKECEVESGKMQVCYKHRASVI